MSRPVGNTTTYDENSNNFAVSPALMLGHLYQQYQEELYLKAVSTPAEYSKTRSEVISKIKIGTVSEIYKGLRSILCEGKMNGVPIIRIGGTAYVPNFPPVDADSRILSIAKALDKELDEIVDIIIPPFSDILKNRLESKAA